MYKHWQVKCQTIQKKKKVQCLDMNGWDTKQFHKKTGKISGDAQEESAFQTLALFLQNLKDSEVLFFFFSLQYLNCSRPN